MPKRLSDYLREITTRIASVYDTWDIAHQNAWFILEHITQKKQAQLIAQQKLMLTQEQINHLEHILYELTVLHKPLQYILGFVPFLDLTLQVKPPILIPRPETEEWVGALILFLKKENQKDIKILDMCTGSGCIALALAQAFPASCVVGSDINPEAVELACNNQKINGIKNCTFVVSDLFDQLPQQNFDLIVSNPPYISKDEWYELEPALKLWEDSRALQAEENGLHIIKRILKEAPHHLGKTKLSSQQLWIEIGGEQGSAVRAHAANNGYQHYQIMKDLFHKERVLICSK